jgi:hypothetical protein
MKSASIVQYQRRVILERQKLIDDYHRIGRSINSEQFLTMDPREASCLIRQHAAMGLYLVAINDRVSLWEEWEH